MQISSVARLNLRHREKAIKKYYNDGGGGKGHCTWGIGILAHRGPCTAEELARPVTDAQIEAEFSARVLEAERAIGRNVKVELTQQQYDALVSYTYNKGNTGAKPVFNLLNDGDFDGAAKIISSEIYSVVLKNGKKVRVLARGLIPRRAEESAPFRKN